MRILLVFIFALFSASADSADKIHREKTTVTTLTGIAQNGKMFAEVKAKEGPMPLVNLARWPKDVEGQQVEVSGQFQTLAATPIDPNTPSQEYGHDTKVFMFKKYKVISKPARK